jgi:hypothetical protein
MVCCRIISWLDVGGSFDVIFLASVLKSCVLLARERKRLQVCLTNKDKKDTDDDGHKSTRLCVVLISG